jgi:hypothetical protein
MQRVSFLDVRYFDGWYQRVLGGRCGRNGRRRNKGGMVIESEKKPNKAPEPMTMAVTPRAIASFISHASLASARGAPAMVVAHL